jgi:hypothetical protein
MKLRPWRRSSAGESARLIIERSAVRVCPPLREKRVAFPPPERSDGGGGSATEGAETEGEANPSVAERRGAR